MNRKEFMEQLEELLKDIPPEERTEALAYYNSYFEDAGEENEANIIKELESPQKVAEIIKADMGMEDEMEYTESGYEDVRFREQAEVVSHTGNTENRSGKKARFTFTEEKKVDTEEDKKQKAILLILLAVITCPIWGGILFGILGSVLGVVLTIIGVVFALLVCVFVFYVAAVVLICIGIAMFLSLNIAGGIGLFGVAFLLLSLAILGTVGCKGLFKVVLPGLIRTVTDLCGRLFHGRRKVV